MNDDSSVWKTFGVGVGLVAAGLLAAWVIGITFFGLNLATSGFRGEAGLQMTVQAAPYRMASYDHFYDQCASIQSLEGAIDQQYDALDRATSEADRSRATTNISGNQTMRLNAINQYNADARKENTEGQYRAAGLPYQILAETYERNGEKTTCGV